MFVNTEHPDIIELRNINQTYDGGKTFVLQNFNLLIEDKPDQGQFVVLLGLSGCGKSTVLRYIAGLQHPTSGEVLIDEHPRKHTDHVGMVFQKYSSFPWLSVLDNVALGLQYQNVNAKERRDRAMDMIVKVGLEGHQNKYAQYPTLSGGQLQRVAIARSLLASPRILLMDEPFGALDITTRLHMQDMLIKIWSEVRPTIVFVTHDIAESVYLGDDIYLMRSSPGYITHHLPVKLPFDRDRSIKRDPMFVQMVNQVEDILTEIYADKLKA